MNQGQVTLDLLVAVMVSIFIFTWLQSYVQIQTRGTQSLGMQRETSQKAIAMGSIANAFRAMEPGKGDYAEQIDPGLENYLKEANSTVNKKNSYLQVTGEYGENQVNYTYPVPFALEYSKNCTEAGGDPCVRK